MKLDFDVHRDVWGPYLTLLLNISPDNTPVYKAGEAVPRITNRTIPAAKLTDEGIFLHLLEELPQNYERIKHFDLSADEYQMATHKFKSHFLKSVFDIINTQVYPDFYIMEAACGPGHEAMKLSSFVPDGEVIAVDLSTEMLKRAYRNSRLNRIRNIGFVQADVHQLPVFFEKHFDLVFCSLSLHFFKNAEKAINQFYKVLRSGGKIVIVEPIGSLEQVSNAPIFKLALPQFQQFYNAGELKLLLKKSGFKTLFQKKIQKNMGLTIAVRP